MIHFFRSENDTIIAVSNSSNLQKNEIKALEWLFSNATILTETEIKGYFIGPRREMITPWSTSAVEITRNMNISGIDRIEEYFPVDSIDASHDKMLQRMYDKLDQNIFKTDKTPEDVIYISDFESYNQKEGLALSDEEINYLKDLSKKLNRPLTDSEVFGFSQVNSEHCRHKIFNGSFIIDDKEMASSLFEMIKRTSKANPGKIVSAYKDNCAFIEGPKITMFHPASGSKPDFFVQKVEDTVISLKAETHNFPTTVEPFNGAATGTGGEIRDRMAGGKGSFPIAGTAVYMTSYPRFNDSARDWELKAPRKWLYQTPLEILIKASNGASDFGNKFGQPIICGSLLTFEHTEKDPATNKDRVYGYDKVIMEAGGVGYAKRCDSNKDVPEAGDDIVLLGGDNYRIGMGGGAVSSVATGEYNNAIELNAVQRANPEMQKRAYNAIRAVSEMEHNTIVSVHDHGAGGHLNCLSELVEDTGGDVDISKLPIGDPTLSDKEVIGNESQERMGLVMKTCDTDELRKIAERERAPFYVIGKVSGNMNFTLKNSKTNTTAIDLKLKDMFGSTPKTVLTDKSPKGGYDGHGGFAPIEVNLNKVKDSEIVNYIEKVLQIESVACKDWLTNKVDRSVTGLIARQQCVGEIQLPLADVAVTALGYYDDKGIATSIGHAPIIALANPEAGSRMSIAEALTNLVWTPVSDELSGVSLSANWMWPSRNPGENARLYKAVQGASEFAIALGLNIPTGKDSMSMTQKYPDGKMVMAPGTLIISSVAECENVYKTIDPVVVAEKDSTFVYIPFNKDLKFGLGGSAFGQVINKVGSDVPDVIDPSYFKECFNTLQKSMWYSDIKRSNDEIVLAGHDISAGGLVTTLLEMCFANVKGGLNIDLSQFENDNILLSEDPGVVLQIRNSEKDSFYEKLGSVKYYEIGTYASRRKLNIKLSNNTLSLDIDKMRDLWYKTSTLFDMHQTANNLAQERFDSYKKTPLVFTPKFFDKERSEQNIDFATNKDAGKITAAIIREKGSNGDREMAWALNAAGFKVKDVHVTDLVSGRETLEDVRMIVFVGGFSNADTLGSAKGWAGAFLYNKTAKEAIDNFYKRDDTLSLGICNGCQLMAELGLITPNDKALSPKMKHNNSKKFESGFVGVTIEKSPSVLLSSLQGSKLGVWVAHGEGKFEFPKPIDNYNVAVRYNYNSYPSNPNGSPEAIAAVCSPDGRHLAMMPHPERCIRPWNWAYNPYNHGEKITPWFELFINGRKWLEKH